MRTDRARLTIVDVPLYLVAFAVMAALWPVASRLMDSNADALGTGPGYLFQVILPVMILVIFVLIWRTSIRGLG